MLQRGLFWVITDIQCLILASLQRSPAHLLRCLVLSLTIQHRRQVVHAVQRGGVLLPQCLLSSLQRSPAHLLCRLVLSFPIGPTLTMLSSSPVSSHATSCTREVNRITPFGNCGRKSHSGSATCSTPGRPACVVRHGGKKTSRSSALSTTITHRPFDASHSQAHTSRRISACGPSPTTRPGSRRGRSTAQS